MWNVSTQSFGFVLTFEGSPSAAELEDWIVESKNRLAGPLPAGWGLVVDMRSLKPLAADAQAVMAKGQLEYKNKGMTRVAVVMTDAIAIMQFRRLGRGTGVDKVERFVNSETTPNWQSVAKAWVVSGTEPPNA